MEKTTNRQILFLFGTLVLLALVCATGNTNFNAKHLMKHGYLGTGAQSAGFISQFLTFMILYDNLIPIR